MRLALSLLSSKAKLTLSLKALVPLIKMKSCLSNMTSIGAVIIGIGYQARTTSTVGTNTSVLLSRHTHCLVDHELDVASPIAASR